MRSDSESYLASRKGKFPSSLLLDTKSKQSFAARFYDTSESHKLLRQTIATRAEAAKREKLVELGQLQNEHQRLDNAT